MGCPQTGPHPSRMSTQAVSKRFSVSGRNSLCPAPTQSTSQNMFPALEYKHLLYSFHASFIHPSSQPSLQPSIHSLVCIPPTHKFRPPSKPVICSSIHPLTNPSIHPLTNPSILPSRHNSSTHPLTNSSDHLGPTEKTDASSTPAPRRTPSVSDRSLVGQRGRHRRDMPAGPPPSQRGSTHLVLRPPCRVSRPALFLLAKQVADAGPDAILPGFVQRVLADGAAAGGAPGAVLRGGRASGGEKDL